MTTIFKNIKWNPAGSEGEIQTQTTLQVYDCKTQQLSQKAPVILRNTLLGGLHPYQLFMSGEIEKTDENPALLNPFTIINNEGNKQITFSLDLASNSRTSGRFTFAEKPIGTFYYGKKSDEQWKRIIYGSIMHTGGKKMIYAIINYIIVDDENRDSEGNYLDDPINNYHWQTGDSHAKASASLMLKLGLNTSPAVGNPEIPLQFRAASFKGWVAKGTVGYNEALDWNTVNVPGQTGLIDLVIPLSCLKGNKPALGNYTGKLLLGLVFEGELRRAKAGWMLFQWFSYSVLEADNIISKMTDKMIELSEAYNSITDLARILRIEQEEANAEIENPNDDIQSIAEYENTAMRCIRADRQGILLLHPYIITRVKQRMQSIWLNLAKSAGVRFWSLMTQPDESLAHYYEVQPDGRITGEKVFCAYDLSEGEYIVFPNPMRHWGDCQLWINRHEGIYNTTGGVIATGKDLLLSLGRDTDGDFLQVIKSSAYPNMREAIADFDESLTVEKLPKVPLEGNLQQIAINSMNDITGIVSTLIGRACANGAEDTILDIPAGGYQYYPCEFRIIDFLSQELQIAVDSLKSAYPNNTNGINTVSAYLDLIEMANGGGIPWLSDFKAPDCYLTRPCDVIENAPDTISRLVKLVNSYWKEADIGIGLIPSDFKFTLFSNEIVHPWQSSYAAKIVSDWKTEFGKAIQWKNENEGDTREIRIVAEHFKNVAATIDDVMGINNEKFTHLSWVAAFWQEAHDVTKGEASSVFSMFPNEIIDALTQKEPPKVVHIYGVQFGSWTKPITPSNWIWTGQSVKIRIVEMTIQGKKKLRAEMEWLGNPQGQVGFHLLGTVGDQNVGNISLGATNTYQIYTERMSKGLTTGVLLLDPTLPDEDKLDFLGGINWMWKWGRDVVYQ